MELQGRELKVNMQGDDVRLLHEELAELGFDIPAEERERAIFGEGALRAVMGFQRQHRLESTGVVDEGTAVVINREFDGAHAPEATFVVHGTITQRGGPVRDAEVRAIGKGVTARQDRPLGDTRSNDDGSYRIVLEPRSGAAPDLVIEVLGRDNSTVAARSPLIIGAAIDQEINLIVESDVIPNEPEFTEIARALDPLLDGADLEALDGASVSYLTGKTNISPLRIAPYLQARRFASEGEVPAEAYYGLLRANLSPNRAALAAQDNSTLANALKQVATTGIVDARLADDEQVSLIVERLNREMVGGIIGETALPDGGATLGAYLDIAGFDQLQKRSFVEALQDNEGHADEFWSQLEQRAGFNAEAVRSAQLASQLSTLTLNNASLATALHARISGVADEPLRELVKLTPDEWAALVRDHRDAAGNPIVPAGVPNVEGIEPAAVYARTMARMVEEAYPTAALVARVQPNAFEGANEVREFVADQPAFELGRESVRHYLRSSNVNLGEPEVHRLEAVQRIFNLAPRFERAETVTALMSHAVTSAWQVRSMGAQTFSKTFEATLGKVATKQIYEAASQKVATATLLYAKYSAAFDSTALNVIPRLNDGAAALLADHPSGIDFPTWEGLFGSTDTCTCEHCDSVFSPSAYLVTILKFLRDRGALDTLFARRPDIGTIDLNCHNTNTTLPYVDLVNEVLEKFLVSSHVVYQTEGDAAALRVHPEHLDPNAYDQLQTRVYPWTAPFSLWSAEARGYLEPLGVARHEIMDHFNAKMPLDRDTADWLPIATEMLGLTTAERGILVDATFRTAHWNGLTAASLRIVQTLLDTARVSFLELRQLLNTRFINADRHLTLDYTVGIGNDAKLTYDLAQVEIPTLGDADLDRIERFTRLRRKLGWNVDELDAAIAALGGDITADVLVNLAFLRQLGSRFRMPLLDTIGWFGNLDTHRWLGEDDEEHGSRYASVFLSRTVGGNGDLAAFDLANLQAGAGTIDEDVPAILAALQITSEDLALIRERRLADSVLSLANLSDLYRVVTMKRAMRLSVRELLDLVELTGIDPFDRTNVANAARLADLTKVIERAGFSIPELAYLLGHAFEPNSRFVPRESATEAFLAALRRELQRIWADFAIVPDSSGETTARLLGFMLGNPADVRKVVALIHGVGSLKELPEDPGAFLDTAFAPFMPDVPARATVISHLIDATDAAFLKPEVNQAERFSLVLEPLALHLRRVNTESLIRQAFADFLEIGQGASDRLLGGLVRSVADAGQPASATFVNDDYVSSSSAITSLAFPDQFAMVTRLQKVAMVVTRLGIDTEELSWLFGSHATLGWLDFNALPVAEEPAPARFQQWLKMALATAIQQGLPTGSPTLHQLLRLAEAGGGATEFDAFLDALAQRTRWNRADVDSLIEGAHLDLDDFDADWGGERTVRNLVALRQCFQDLRQLGVSAKTALGWAVPVATQAMAAEIKQAARAKYTESQWLSVAEPIRDDLRRQQRVALVEAAIDKIDDADIKDTNDLYAFFLMDVAMNPCLETSRIVFAHGAVQLFVQRCLLHLEHDVHLTTADAALWAGMKTYRLNEAALQVFYNTENYCEPGLRPNKSPFFQELEDELLQNDITDDNVELAYQHYLERLDEVARLEVVGVWNEEDTNTLHVIGRTKGTPGKFFYRQWYKARRWTPWEEVPVEIEGTTATPVVYNRRLYLFWFTTQVLAEEEIPGSNSGQKPNRYLQIRLAWSQFRQRKWSPKHISDVWIETSPTGRNRIVGPASHEHPLDPAGYRPRPVIQPNGDLLIAAERSSSVTGMTSLDSFFFTTPANFLFVHDGQIELTRYDPSPGQTQLSRPVENGRSWSYCFQLPGNKALKMRGYDGTYQTVFDLVPFPSRITVPLQYTSYDSTAPFFIEDRDRSYFVTTKHVLGPKSAPFVEKLRIDPPPFGIYMHADELVLVPDVLAGIGLDAGSIDSSPIWSLNPTAGPMPSDAVSAVNSALLRDPTLDVVNGGAPIIATGQGTLQILGRQPVFAEDAFLRTVPALAVRSGLAAEGSTAQILTESPRHYDELVVANGIMELGRAVPIWRTRFSEYRSTEYTFQNFYHPYVNLLIKQLNRHGVAGILDPLENGEAHDLRRQLKTETPANSFTNRYDTGDRINADRLPVEEFDFEYGAPYSIYNTELFCDVPYLIGNVCSSNGNFALAQKWYHYIFDPTDNSAVDPRLDAYRFWKVKPFFLNTKIQTIDQMLRLLSSENPANLVMRERLEAQVRDWREDPFQPYVIAEQRPVAYQKAIVMHYSDNCLAWVDSLIREGTMESLNEATQICVLLSELFGKRPEEVPQPEGSRLLEGQPVSTFNDLEPHLDALGNIVIQLENAVGNTSTIGASQSFAESYDSNEGVGSSTALDAVPEPPLHEIVGSTLFFCVPRNAKLLSYWDKVADRLFKIRNCMDLDGRARQIALFAPPIDPALLVRAAAAGVDLSSVLNDVNGPRPHHHFPTLLRLAVEFANEVRQHGAALLQALQNRDAEDLALRRQEYEQELLDAVRIVRRKQIDESKESIAALNHNLDAAKARHQFHANRPTRIPNEALHLSKMESAAVFQELAEGYALVGSALGLLPEFDIGVEGGFSSPVAKVSFGGSQLSRVANFFKELHSLYALVERGGAERASVLASLDRRQEEWNHQADQGDFDTKALQRQVVASEIRKAIAEQELENTELQIQQSQKVEEFYRDKFTNKALHSWTVSQLSALHFQAYQLAYGMAIQCQSAYQHGLADYDASFIRFDNWDSLKKGLLAGERLTHDLRRMEAAWYANSGRELELTRRVSLAQIDPAALVALRETGICEVEIPEALFNLDYPGHYLRRLKSVGLTLPCVVGPYTGVHCTLTLLSNRIRVSTDDPEIPYQGVDDPHFITNLGGVQSIATSTGQNDHGLFELNLHDERLLPFEGAGAISRWRIAISNEFPAFPVRRLADAIFDFQLTAVDGGARMRELVAPELTNRINEIINATNETGLYHFSALTSDYPTEFNRFLHPTGAADYETPLTISRDQFPYLFTGRDISIERVVVLFTLRDPGLYEGLEQLEVELKRGDRDARADLTRNAELLAGLPAAEYEGLAGDLTGEETWTLRIAPAALEALPQGLRRSEIIDGRQVARLREEAIADVGLLLRYRVT